MYSKPLNLIYSQLKKRILFCQQNKGGFYYIQSSRVVPADGVFIFYREGKYLLNLIILFFLFLFI